MMGRTSLVEQKRIQWAKEKEEMARLNGHWDISKSPAVVQSNIRSKISSRELNNNRKPLRTYRPYESSASLKSVDTNVSTCLQSLDLNSVNSGSVTNINGHAESQLNRKRSPSLPPIHSKEHQHGQHQIYARQELPCLEVEGSHYTNHPRVQKHSDRETERRSLTYNRYEEREGETSGYASDSVDAPVALCDIKKLLPLEKLRGTEMPEKTWQNPYCDSPDTSLPLSTKFPATRLGELNRPRWGSIWAPENGSNDPPPPSWLERGLSRMDHSSQVLVINHESASSPDSSATSSINSDSKTYLRGQNIPVDAQILHEREARRQKALELQNAIKQQLAEKDRKRKEEKEQQIKEEREEEERIKRECNKERERFEEEQRRAKEKEQAKLRKEEAMREILERAERIAEGKKRHRRQPIDYVDRNTIEDPRNMNQVSTNNDNCCLEIDESNHDKIQQNPQMAENGTKISAEHVYPVNITECNETNSLKTNEENSEKQIRETLKTKDNLIRLPINKEVAIVLTGKIEETDCFDGKNLQLFNLVVSPTPRRKENSSNTTNTCGINALLENLNNLGPVRNTCPPIITENRLLTPSKYRSISGRDFGTQTDVKNDIHNMEAKQIVKERHEGVHNNGRHIDKLTNTLMNEKNARRSKSQPRQTLETRPRWNANRPGTRYRTQSEKDPHYQRRLRLRRRRVESSDERSRSPSSDRQIFQTNNHNAFHQKSKLDNYDGNMSMDSLNSVVPLQIDEDGRINVRINPNVANVNTSTNEFSSNSNDESKRTKLQDNLNNWHEQNIISQLTSLKHGLLSKQREWDSSRCLLSPNSEFY